MKDSLALTNEEWRKIEAETAEIPRDDDSKPLLDEERSRQTLESERKPHGTGLGISPLFNS